MRYVSAKELALMWDCSLRTAQRAIYLSSTRIKIGRKYYADYHTLQRKPIGNPNLRTSREHQRAAARARWKK